MRSSLQDATKGIVSDLMDGTSAAETFANALGKIGDKLIDMALSNVFGSLLGGAIIPGVSGGTAVRDGYGHGRAFAPSTWAGAPRYHNGGIAGLRPGEIPAILQRGERVIPNGAGGATGVRVWVENGNIRAEIDDRVSRGMTTVRREVPGIVANAQLRGG